MDDAVSRRCRHCDFVGDGHFHTKAPLKEEARHLHAELREDLEASRKKMALDAWKDMNPRVVLWLRAHGLPVVVTSPVDGQTQRVTVGGHLNLWTVHYSGWIVRMWAAWAASLGYREAGAARAAIADGHATFDAWLEKEVEKLTR